MFRHWSLAGDGPEVAARQIALVLAGFALLGAAVLPATQGWPRSLLAGETAAHLVLAAAGWWLPWLRWPPWAPLTLALAEMVILATNTWVFATTVVGSAPFFLLLFVWAGINFPVRAVAALAPTAVLAFLGPLLATGRTPSALAGAFVFIPTMLITGLVLAHQTERRRRDLATLRRAHEELQRAERWRAALTATLAHDVRSPLTAVQFALETLRVDDLTDEQREQIAGAGMRQAGRICRLAGSLLDADRVDTHGELRLDLRPVSLYAAAGEAAGYLTCPVSIEMDTDATVYADADRLEQILVNLATNAARHGRPPIVISAGPVGDGQIAISVRDHGPGVPEELRGMLFSRFSSADTAPESVGLGLWITRELARAHGGDVSYTPADPGARFTVILPAADLTGP